MHLVYYLQNPGEEFRYSLRAAQANLPVSKVTVIGDAPSWLKYAKVLPGNPSPNANINSVANAHIAARAIPGEFVMMNDDFFVMTPMDRIPHFWYHSLTAHAGQYQDPRSQHWRDLYQHTARYLTQRNVMMPKSFELHIPMTVIGAELDAILAYTAKDNALQGPGLWRSLYGNLSSTVAREGSIRRGDVKVYNEKSFLANKDFVSTDEKTLRSILPLLKERFPDRSKWEKA